MRALQTIYLCLKSYLIAIPHKDEKKIEILVDTPNRQVVFTFGAISFQKASNTLVLKNKYKLSERMCCYGNRYIFHELQYYYNTYIDDR